MGGSAFTAWVNPFLTITGKFAVIFAFPNWRRISGFPKPKHRGKPLPRLPLYWVWHEDTACYLLYNGILKDKSVNGGNVLTSKVLASLPAHDGPKVIYGERCLFSPARLQQLNITFKHTPYDIKGR